MPPTRDGIKHDPITNVIASILDEFNVEYSEDPQHPIAGLKRSQVREEKNAESIETIALVKAKLASGQPLPAIVVTADGTIIDGNGRVIGARKAKHTTLYALVTKKTAEQLGDTFLEILGARLNDHGKRRAKAEIDRSMRKLIGDDATTERIVEHLSVEASRVRNMRAQILGEQRVVAAGLSSNGFRIAHLKTIGRADMLEAPLNGTIKLAHDSGMAATEIGDLIKRLRAQSSEAEQLALLDHERTELADRIAEHKRTGNGKPPAARRAKQQLAAFLAIGAPEQMVERTPDRIVEQLQTLRQAAKTLAEMVTLQEQEAQRAGVELL